MERVLKRGHFWYRATFWVSVLVELIIIAIQVASCFVKQRIFSKSYNHQALLNVDKFEYFFFAVYFLAVTTALIIFKVLESRHRMRIKKLQIMIAALLGICVLVAFVLYAKAGVLMVHLMCTSPLPQYPEDDISEANRLHEATIFLSFLVYSLTGYLILQIGRAGHQ